MKKSMGSKKAQAEQKAASASPKAPKTEETGQPKPFKCDHDGCGKEFSTDEMLGYHKACHVKNEVLVEKHGAEYMAQNFGAGGPPAAAPKTEETGQPKPFKCDHDGCGKEFSTDEMLGYHKACHVKNEVLVEKHGAEYMAQNFGAGGPPAAAPKTEETGQPKPFKCDHDGCGKEFSTDEMLGYHKACHVKNEVLVEKHGAEYMAQNFGAGGPPTSASAPASASKQKKIKLISACAKNEVDLDVIKSLIDEYDVQRVNEKDSFGRSALFLACRHPGAKELVKLLLLGGAFPDIRTNNMTTPLHVACRNGNLGSLAVVKVLLETGNVDVNAVDGRQREGEMGLTMTALHYAAKTPGPERLAKVRSLVNAGAKVNCLACDEDATLPQTCLGMASEELSAHISFFEKTGKALGEKGHDTELAAHLVADAKIHYEGHDFMWSDEVIAKSISEFYEDGLPVMKYLKEECGARDGQAIIAEDLKELLRPGLEAALPGGVTEEDLQAEYEGFMAHLIGDNEEREEEVSPPTEVQRYQALFYRMTEMEGGFWAGLASTVRPGGKHEEAAKEAEYISTWSRPAAPEVVQADTKAAPLPPLAPDGER
jgi:hypothetical protein